jgi:hypothetical protein
MKHEQSDALNEKVGSTMPERKQEHKEEVANDVIQNLGEGEEAEEAKR